MSYALHTPRTTQAVWDSMPTAASEALATAMMDVCDDPYATTQPYGEDDGVMRHLVLPTVMAVLLIDAPTMRIVVVQINHFG